MNGQDSEYFEVSKYNFECVMRPINRLIRINLFPSVLKNIYTHEEYNEILEKINKKKSSNRVNLILHLSGFTKKLVKFSYNEEYEENNLLHERCIYAISTDIRSYLFNNRIDKKNENPIFNFYNNSEPIFWDTHTIGVDYLKDVRLFEFIEFSLQTNLNFFQNLVSNSLKQSPDKKAFEFNIYYGYARDNEIYESESLGFKSFFNQKPILDLVTEKIKDINGKFNPIYQEISNKEDNGAQSYLLDYLRDNSEVDINLINIRLINLNTMHYCYYLAVFPSNLNEESKDKMFDYSSYLGQYTQCLNDMSDFLKEGKDFENEQITLLTLVWVFADEKEKFYLDNYLLEDLKNDKRQTIAYLATKYEVFDLFEELSEKTYERLNELVFETNYPEDVKTNLRLDAKLAQKNKTLNLIRDFKSNLNAHLFAECKIEQIFDKKESLQSLDFCKCVNTVLSEQKINNAPVDEVIRRLSFIRSICPIKNQSKLRKDYDGHKIEIVNTEDKENAVKLISKTVENLLSKEILHTQRQTLRQIQTHINNNLREREI